MNIRHNNDEPGFNKPSEPEDIREQINTIRNDIFPSHYEESFFEQCYHPAFVLHLFSGVFIEVNEPFQSLYGYDRDALTDGSTRADDLIHTEKEQLLKLARRAPDRIPDGTYSAFGLDHRGQTFPIRLAIRSRTVRDHQLLYGVMREISGEKERKKTLKKQLNEAVEANNRILALTEKIRKVPKLTSNLMNRDPEQDFFRTAASRLQERTGLNYRGVTFYLFNESRTALKPSSPETSDREPILPDADHPVARVLSGDEPILRSGTNEFVLQLRGENRDFGVLQVNLHPRERKLMEGNQSIWNAYRETLVTLSNLFGLLLQNSPSAHASPG